ncbi:hypothetical protein PAXINDRAFT_17427 [Paxillus involutus ATCC 200175]|uniref:Uncharacterized protein n=1 Tax=Paxillus involutus ATCC 200175 TaxID=664439 RepID=A0A0C9T190_PAXIN|nr:hypothetical protein PAXINDRAFT_17427 [Paxillus involutus ATCC 200175]
MFDAAHFTTDPHASLAPAPVEAPGYRTSLDAAGNRQPLHTFADTIPLQASMA